MREIFNRIKRFEKRLAEFESRLNELIRRHRLLLVLLGLAVAAIGLWLTPKWQTSGLTGGSSTELAKLQDSFRSTLAQIAGGVILLGGLFFTAIRASAARRGQIGESLTRATEQLISDKLEVRVAGIMALEAIGRESEKERWQIVEVLTSFIREHSRRHQAAQDPRVPSRDVQAGVSAIGRLIRAEDVEAGHCADLRGCHLTGASLRELCLIGALLEDAILDGAFLEGADLSKADFSGASLRMANLSGANLAEAQLTEVVARDADFGGANLWFADFERADLRGADFTSANFDEAKIYGTRFEGADLSEALGSPFPIAIAYFDARTRPPKWLDHSGVAAGGLFTMQMRSDHSKQNSHRTVRR
jgi:hypothetical protein